jgi:hypothetical protein
MLGASSPDLIYWRRHPPMLSPYPGNPDDGIFSGNAFVDKLGRVVLHYHGVNAGNCIAINDDDDLIQVADQFPLGKIVARTFVQRRCRPQKRNVRGRRMARATRPVHPEVLLGVLLWPIRK